MADSLSGFYQVQAPQWPTDHERLCLAGLDTLISFYKLFVVLDGSREHFSIHGR